MRLPPLKTLARGGEKKKKETPSGMCPCLFSIFVFRASHAIRVTF